MCVVSKKRGRKKRKEGKFRKKVHKFSFILSLCSKNEAFFSRKIRPFETKFLLLRLTKHNFPFTPPHCGVHIAQSRGTFPDHPAQTLFDLLNHRNFALPRPTGTSSKTLSLNVGWHLHYSDITLSPCTKRRRHKEPDFVPSEKGCMPSLDNAVLATPIRFLSYLPCSECSCVWSVFSYCISKLSAGAVIVPFVGQLQNSPRIGERRDSWGVVSYPNVEKGAIRNRRVRAHAPQRHRVRPRPYHLPWRSGVRHRHRP